MANVHPKAGRLWLRLSLGRITLVVWLAWLGGVALMWGMYRFRVMHPHFLPLTTLLAMQVIGGLAVFFGGLWGVFRGPQRANSLGWLLLGTAPLWLWGAHISYGMWVAHDRSVPSAPGPVVKLGAPGASALLDGLVRYRYPSRLEGRRVVMVYDQLADPTGDLAAMDRVVERMEELLGWRCKAKVHWIRGSVIGLGPNYNQGLAFGAAPADRPGLTETDRHEVAHFVADDHCGPDSVPPGVLVEGWAETQSDDPGYLAGRAWRWKRHGGVLTLRELISEDWYNSRETPVYVQGGVLVNFILREYGPKKLFELYTTCRPETFAEDCRRILGIGLEELDRRYWADVERQVAQMGELFGPNPFWYAKVGEGVDLAVWNAFLQQFRSGQEQLEAPFRQVQMEIESTSHVTSTDGTPPFSSERIIVAHDGNRHRWICESDGYAEVRVANPGGSFMLHRKSADSQWTQTNLRHSDDPKLTYSYCNMSSREEAVRRPDTKLARFVVCPNEIITAVEQFAQDGQNRIRISYQGSSLGPKGRYTKHGSIVFRPDAHCAVQSASSSTTLEDGKLAVERRLEVEYGPTHGGVPVVRRIQETETSDNSRAVLVTEIRRCDFAPTPEKEFTLGAFDVAPPAARAWLDRIGVPWHAIVTWFGAAVSLVLGVAVRGWLLLRKR